MCAQPRNDCNMSSCMELVRGRFYNFVLREALPDARPPFSSPAGTIKCQHLVAAGQGVKRVRTTEISASSALIGDA